MKLFIQRIRTDFDILEVDPWKLFNLDEVMPDNLGPDHKEEVDI
jgi:hypothetical protein